MSIKHIQGDLFNIAPVGSYLAHACNAKGVWGAGIASHFRHKYPDDYTVYSNAVLNPGGVLITPNKIICLVTSNDYGRNKDSVDQIIKNTTKSLMGLASILPKDSTVYSPKFNSGLFNVPWHKTESLIASFLIARPDIKWVVCSY